jgi:hypothetical protein
MLFPFGSPPISVGLPRVVAGNEPKTLSTRQQQRRKKLYVSEWFPVGFRLKVESKWKDRACWVALSTAILNTQKKKKERKKENRT